MEIEMILIYWNKYQKWNEIPVSQNHGGLYGL